MAEINSSCCYYSNYEDSMVTYLGALSHINAILIPRISAHPPILAQCKVHRPWALFREGTVLGQVGLITYRAIVEDIISYPAMLGMAVDSHKLN